MGASIGSPAATFPTIGGAVSLRSLTPFTSALLNGQGVGGNRREEVTVKITFKNKHISSSLRREQSSPESPKGLNRPHPEFILSFQSVATGSRVSLILQTGSWAALQLPELEVALLLSTGSHSLSNTPTLIEHHVLAPSPYPSVRPTLGPPRMVPVSLSLGQTHTRSTVHGFPSPCPSVRPTLGAPHTVPVSLSLGQTHTWSTVRGSRLPIPRSDPHSEHRAWVPISLSLGQTHTWSTVRGSRLHIPRSDPHSEHHAQFPSPYPSVRPTLGAPPSSRTLQDPCSLIRNLQLRPSSHCQDTKGKDCCLSPAHLTRFRNAPHPPTERCGPACKGNMTGDLHAARSQATEISVSPGYWC
ncbi:uncharacterized protein LOC125487743 [Rhincodon typus]|uniref:uncharacterized protein LOC125487743 n=1 Tax=Rhincodon typus TaxID=259920 RepID=UPI0020305BC4|nr:uncharacterized protein LOC125487743 [Rhincodon typus]